MNSTKKCLALFMPGLYEGGAERIMLNLAAGLVVHGYAVDLVLAQAEGPYVEQIPKSVRVVELNERHRRSFRTLSSLPALVRYLRHERPYAVLSALNANFVALWARRIAGIPQRLVISEHNTFSRQNQQLPRVYRGLMLELVRCCYPWADGIVAVSEGVADDLAQVSGVSRDRIQVIYNPIVTPELEAKTKDILKHPWFDPSEPPVVLAVGRLTDQKDFSTLIQAFARVRRTRTARLLILGEGEERPKLSALVRQFALEQDVQFPGFVPNPYPYMARAALFALSSKWEGLPTVLVEALYCGVPVIATDCPSGPGEILRDGQYGQLVQVGNVASLAQAMERMLDHTTPAPPRESWQPFELETAVDQYMRILLGI
jgi:glycosyltransferase involved in cell wall biosynthesis